MSAFDWRSESAYDSVYGAEAMDIAWEWLRRDGEYQKAFSITVAFSRGF
jgi:hypothetical protein